MVAFGQREAHLLFRVGIEKDQTGRFRLHHLAADQLAVHPDTEHYGLCVRGPFARQSEADNVLAIEIDPVAGFDGARIHPADALVLGGVFHREGLGQRIGRHGARGDPLGRSQIFFHEHRRDGEDVANVVEALAGIVGGEVFLRAKLHAQQVANRVGVFVPVQAVDGDPARVKLRVEVRLREFTLDVLDQGVDLRLRPWYTLGRHLPGTELLKNQLPAFPFACERCRIEKRRGVKAARGQLAVVTKGASVGENGRDSVFERRGTRPLSRLLRGCRQRRHRRGQDSSHVDGENPVATSTHTLLLLPRYLDATTVKKDPERIRA